MLKSTLTMLSVLGERMKARDPRRSPCGEGRADQPAPWSALMPGNRQPSESW